MDQMCQTEKEMTSFNECDQVAEENTSSQNPTENCDEQNLGEGELEQVLLANEGESKGAAADGESMPENEAKAASTEEGSEESSSGGEMDHSEMAEDEVEMQPAPSETTTTQSQQTLTLTEADLLDLAVEVIAQAGLNAPVQASDTSENSEEEPKVPSENKAVIEAQRTMTLTDADLLAVVEEIHLINDSGEDQEVIVDAQAMKMVMAEEESATAAEENNNKGIRKGKNTEIGFVTSEATPEAVSSTIGVHENNENQRTLTLTEADLIFEKELMDSQVEKLPAPKPLCRTISDDLVDEGLFTERKAAVTGANLIDNQELDLFGETSGFDYRFGKLKVPFKPQRAIGLTLVIGLCVSVIGGMVYAIAHQENISRQDTMVQPRTTTSPIAKRYIPFHKVKNEEQPIKKDAPKAKQVATLLPTQKGLLKLEKHSAAQVSKQASTKEAEEEKTDQKPVAHDSSARKTGAAKEQIAAKTHDSQRLSTKHRNGARVLKEAKKQPPKPEERYLEQAQKAKEKGQWERARNRAKVALKFNKKNRRAKVLIRQAERKLRQKQRYLDHAKRELRRKQWKRAQADAKAALRVSAHDRRAARIKRLAEHKLKRHKLYIKQARAAARKGNWRRARAKARAALRINAKDRRAVAIKRQAERKLRQKRRHTERTNRALRSSSTSKRGKA